MYLKSVDDIITGNGLSLHIYADDIRVYLTASLDSTENSSLRISSSLNAVMSYMNMSKLKLNDDKTKMIVVTAPTLCYHGIEPEDP